MPQKQDRSTIPLVQVDFRDDSSQSEHVDVGSSDSADASATVGDV